MADKCKLIAEVTIEGLTTLGKAPAMGTYICVQSAATVPPASPYICAGTASATAIGTWLNSGGPALQKVSKVALGKGCQVVVTIGENNAKIMLIEAKKKIKQAEISRQKAIRQFKALDTPQGLSWLIRYLSGVGR